MADLFLVDSESGSSLLLRQELSGIANRGYSEQKAVRFRCVAPGDWTLYIDDAPLPRARIGEATVWVWAPGFFAGTVRADLVEEATGNSTRFLLDVSPDPAKLGQDTFMEMVEDIKAFDIGLILGTEPAQISIGQAGRTEDPSVRLARMLRHGKALLSAMQRLVEEPHRTQRDARQFTRASNVRHADAHTIRASITSGACLVVRDTGKVPGLVRGREPLFDVPVSEMTFDSPANRALLSIVNAILGSAARIVTTFEERIEQELDDATNTALKERWPRRRGAIDAFVSKLKRYLRMEPLRSVTRAEMSASGLTSMTTHPRYARVRQLAWNILRPGYIGSSGAESSWMSPTWHVYEAWCMVRLSDALRQGIPELAWRVVKDSRADYCFQGQAGSTTITLRYQPTFRHSGKNGNEHEFHSISCELRPDIVFAIETPTASRWAVLDAKYSQSRSSVLKAMRSAHIYHDALRWNGQPPDESMLLVPSNCEGAAWLHESSYQQSHGVGVIALSPNHKFEDELVTATRSLCFP